MERTLRCRLGIHQERRERERDDRINFYFIVSVLKEIIDSAVTEAKEFVHVSLTIICRYHKGNIENDDRLRIICLKTCYTSEVTVMAVV